MDCAIIGAGSWGTALAMVLSGNGHTVRLWDRDPERLAGMKEAKENSRYLPGVVLPQGLIYESDAVKAIAESKMAVFAVPAQHFGGVFGALSGNIKDDVIIVNVAKGIDCKSLKRISQIAEEIKPGCRFVALSGPSHAEEVARMMPTAVVAASARLDDARTVQDAFMNSVFRVYTNSDVTGVELGGALKNIIALGAGISDGLGFGDNTKAALITRGVSEIIRLGIKMGADVSTFSGLAGIGDLIVTCSSIHSRNRRCGMLIGRGVPCDEAVKQVGMVVEGVYTVKAAARLSEELGVEMPITFAIDRIIDGKLSPAEAADRLMNRKKKHENEELFSKK